MIGLLSSVDHSLLSIWNSNSSTQAGAYHHTLPPLTVPSIGTRGGLSTAFVTLCDIVTHAMHALLPYLIKA